MVQEQKKEYTRGKQIGAIVLGNGLNPQIYMAQAMDAGHDVENKGDHYAIYEMIEKKAEKK
jgi:hypothetical protein